MSTISTPQNNHLPMMPLPMPSYAYRYPNSDSQPFSSIPSKIGIYNPTSSCTYKWENNFPENTKTVRNLTYIAPTEFKQPPKHFALSPNWPKENYSPKFVDRSSLLASKGYVPHFNNKTSISWKRFLSETPERFQITSKSNDRVINLGSESHLSRPRADALESAETTISGIGPDFAQRPVMALSSQYRNNDGFRHSNITLTDNWKPYGNPPAYFNNYIIGSPKF